MPKQTNGQSDAMDSPKKILILRPGAMGDILFTTPALRGLKARFPQSQITYAALRKWAFLLRRNPNVDRVFEIGRMSPDALDRLRSEHFDIIINFFEFPIGAEMLEGLDGEVWLGGRLVGGRLVPSPDSRWLMKDTATQQALRAEGIHYPEVYCRIAGVKAAGEQLDFEPGFVDFFRAGIFAHRHRLSPMRQVIALHLHSRGSSAKTWPLDSVRGFIESVRRWRPGQYFLVLGYAKDREVTRELEGMEKVMVCYAPISVQAALMRWCSVFVGIDSGPRQMALAMGVPTVTLLGNRSASFLPYGSGDCAIEAGRPCAPCFDDICPKGEDCLRAIDPKAIAKAALEILQDRAVRF